MTIDENWVLSILRVSVHLWLLMFTHCEIQHIFIIFRISFNCKHKEIMMQITHPDSGIHLYIYSLTPYKKQVENGNRLCGWLLLFPVFSMTISPKIISYFSIWSWLLGSEWPPYNLFKKIYETSSLICKYSN